MLISAFKIQKVTLFSSMAKVLAVMIELIANAKASPP
eukprot:XP_001705024.1 Hypothetical protein GL50803_6946 [Giardia lamblia ATCC 50803]